MRLLATGVFMTVLAVAPAVAQQPAKSLASPAPSGPTLAAAMYRMLTVTYPAISQGKMTLVTPAGKFDCLPPGTLSAGLPKYTCKLKVRRLPLALQASWLVQNGPLAVTGNGKPVVDKQWEGDCAGTVGDNCVLDMSSDRTVNINPYAKATGQ